MGAIDYLVQQLGSSPWARVGATIIVLLAYPIYKAVYNVFFHPLAHIPGPTAWSASRIPFVWNLLRGTLIRRQRQLHEQYGTVFRMAPDEISFASEEAWMDIYSWRKGHKRAIRDPAFSVAPPGQADNIITTSDVKFHARVRGLMSHSFTEDALRDQSQLIENHADMYIHQLWKAASSNGSKGALMNMTEWVNFFTMDVIGDLAFGEPFGCLASGQYHDWVRTLYQFLKAMTIAAAPRYWPTLQFLLEKAIPDSVMEGQRRHQQYANDKINRRLDSKSQRPDFVTPFMKENPNFEKMSRDEILSSFSFIIVGGSETSATAMTGMFNHLGKSHNKHILKRLVQEIRAKYATEDDITIDKVNRSDHLYLDAVIQEGLRICHPVPSGMPRMVPQGGDFYGGIYLPEKTRLGVRIFAVNRSAKLFARPDEFIPERWLPKGERPSEFDNDCLSASKPFSVGFHSCLGRPLAWLEMRLILTRTLWAFDISEDPAKAVSFDDFPMMMMVEKQPMYLCLRARSDAAYKATVAS